MLHLVMERITNCTDKRLKVKCRLFETYVSHAENLGSIPRRVTLNPLVLDSYNSLVSTVCQSEAKLPSSKESTYLFPKLLC